MVVLGEIEDYCCVSISVLDHWEKQKTVQLRVCVHMFDQ